MAGNSSVAGYITPASSPTPLEDDSFEDFLQAVIVGITGLAGANVRPRWQPDVPNLPARNEDWCAFGIKEYDPDTYAVTEHHPEGTGKDTLQRHETVEILTSWYGSNAAKYAAVFSDGLQIAQNRAAMIVAGVGQVETGRKMAVPVLVKDKWLKRIDMPWVIRRQVLRDYSIYNILSANGTIYTDTTPQITAPIEVTA